MVPVHGGGDGRHSGDHAFPGRGDGARVVNVHTEVGTEVDSRHHEIRRRRHETQHGQGHAVRGRSRRNVGRGPIGQGDLIDAQGLVHGLVVARGRPVVVGCQHGRLPYGGHGLGQSVKSGRCYTVVVGDEDLGHGAASASSTTGGRAGHSPRTMTASGSISSAVIWNFTPSVAVQFPAAS